MADEIILSLVIVNWNSVKETFGCLNSIFEITDFKNQSKNLEVIVIDNNSGDGSVRKIRDKFPAVKVIENEINEGYASACNKGMREAKGKYVLLLGNDTKLKDNSLSEVIAFLETNKTCGAAGCRLVYPDGRLQGNCKKFPGLSNAFFTYLSLNRFNRDYDMQWFKYDKTIEVDQVATTFLMVRNEILKGINYFDEQYRILYNDVDLCRKIWQAGYKIFFLHTAETVHLGSHSTKKAGFKVRKIMYGDIFRYYRNNFGIKAYLLLPVLAFRLLFVSIIKA